MARILSSTSTTSSLASILSGFAAAAISSMLPGFKREVETLPARLRYDLGELDMNPDLHCGHSHGASDVGREIMRRHF